MGGFRCPGREWGLRADVPKPAADAGGGESPGRDGPFPGAAQIGGAAAGQSKLGVGGDHQPVPAISGGWFTDLRCGPSEGLLEQPEGVFEVEPAQKRLPTAIDLSGDEGAAGGGVGGSSVAADARILVLELAELH